MPALWLRQFYIDKDAVSKLVAFFVAAMCMMYPQQIGGIAVKGLVLFSDIFAKIFTEPFLKALGI